MLNSKPLRSELDYLIHSIKELRRIRREEGYRKADKFRKEMQAYFRLNDEMMSPFVHDQLLRLADTPAGTSKHRSDVLLKQLHAMEKGDRFTLLDRTCLFRWHTGAREDMQEGFFEYVYEDAPSVHRTLDYNEAWSLMQQGELILHVQRA